MKKICLLLMLISIVMLGCAHRATQPIAQTAVPEDYGPLPVNYEQIIKDVISPSLIDPYSAVYTLSAPKQGKNTMTGDTVYGWNICGTVNAKNRFGGYVGPKPIYAMIYRDRVIRLLFQSKMIPDSFKMGIISGTMSTSGSADTFCN